MFRETAAPLPLVKVALSSGEERRGWGGGLQAGGGGVFGGDNRVEGGLTPTRGREQARGKGLGMFLLTGLFWCKDRARKGGKEEAERETTDKKKDKEYRDNKDLSKLKINRV